ncbi:MAG: NTP transferase domain-containing protein [Planctomycetales bacterium]|nr:NTP transferase domain-containing protein [Planctomycetales bacterium]
MTADQPMAIVLAAGKGTRMESDLPKVLFPACGKPMVHWVIDALRTAGVGRIVVVVGYQAERVQETLADRDVEFALQEQQLGTGHAVNMCRQQLAEQQGPVLVLAGDSPLVQVASLQDLLQRFERDRPACLLGTLHKDDPHGLGRIVRNAGQFAGIVEEKDATEQQRKITEVNMSTYVFEPRALEHALDRLSNNNRQGEYYLTDCPGILIGEGRPVAADPVLRPCEAMSVNTPDELRQVEAEMVRIGYTRSGGDRV